LSRTGTRTQSALRYALKSILCSVRKK